MKRPGIQSSEKAAVDAAFSHFPTFDIERALISEGYRFIAGIDEAGRGALAGPLCVGMVIFSSSSILSPTPALTGVKDSKLLTHPRRCFALDLIKQDALVATSRLVSHRLIDRLNINGATEYAIRCLIDESPITPDIIILDGTFNFSARVPIKCVPKGDRVSFSIAGASIVAKVRRDGILKRLDALYPAYQFSRNKGYGTRHHLAALRDNGPSPVHRMSYRPVCDTYRDEAM